MDGQPASDAFDLGESSIQVRRGAAGRGWGRVAAAVGMVAVGGFVGIIDSVWKVSHDLLLEWTGLEILYAKISLGSALAAVGYAIYDYRWPFGPRPGMRAKAGREEPGREARGSEDY